jgi:hypothetical protein
MAVMPQSARAGRQASDDMRRSYLRVIVSWLAMLAALYVFQEYFS